MSLPVFVDTVLQTCYTSNDLKKQGIGIYMSLFQKNRPGSNRVEDCGTGRERIDAAEDRVLFLKKNKQGQGAA